MLHVVHVLPVLPGTGQLQNSESLPFGFSISVAWIAAGFALHGHATSAAADVVESAAPPLTNASVGNVEQVKRQALASSTVTSHDLCSIALLTALKKINTSSEVYLPFLFAIPGTISISNGKYSSGRVNRIFPNAGGAEFEALWEIAAPHRRQKTMMHLDAREYTRLTAVQMVMSCAA